MNEILSESNQSFSIVGIVSITNIGQIFRPQNFNEVKVKELF